MTFLGVRAGGHETLADVKSRLGATEIWETGDASTSTSQICYRVPVTNGSVIILFGSSGEAAEPSLHLAKELGINFVAAGHYATEKLGVQALTEKLADRFDLEWEFVELPNPV